jgi:hypothetical protein
VPLRSLVGRADAIGKLCMKKKTTKKNENKQRAIFLFNINH